MRKISIAAAVLFALLPGIAAAQQILPKNTVLGRLGVTASGPAQAIPFATLFGNAGVPAGPLSCSTSNWFNTLSSGGVLGCAQPAITDISGLGTGVATALAIAANGSGGLVTSPVPYANLHAGVSDTALGYWGSTVASATAVGNCAVALTYSTSTHTFGCNNGVGAGTVTSVATSGLASGGPITGSGTVTVTAAAKSDEQAGSSAVLATTPSQQGQHDSAAKAHGLFTISGTTLTLAANSLNISAVGSGSSRTGTGQYIVGFPTNFANATYDCTVTVTGTTSTSAVLGMVGQASYTAAQISVTVTQATAFSVADPAAFSIQCFGRQ